MPELKIARTYHEILRRIGVQGPGEANVQTPVQLVAKVDDLSHLVAPIEVPRIIFGVQLAAPGAGIYNGITINAVTRGYVLEWILANGNTSLRIQYTRGAVDTDYLNLGLNPFVPLGEFGPYTTEFYEGTSNIAPVAIGTFRTLNIDQWIEPKLYVPPGEVVAIMNYNANNIFYGDFMIQEIPVPQVME